jgi:hypothetical protein
MIVQPRDGALLLVRQTDHAALSGTLAEHWGGGPFARPTPRPSVLVAAARHDDGWGGWEARPQVNPATRRPYQFTELPVREHYAFYAEGIAAVIRDDPYAGLLVSMHLSGLYRQRHGLDPALGLDRFPPELRPVVEGYLRDLAAQQHALRERLLDESDYPAEAVEELAVWTNYKLLQVYDLFSLYLCLSRPREWTLRHVPVNDAHADVEMLLRPAGGDALTVTPYPFDEAPLRVSVPARVVPDRDYADDEDLRAALAAAEATELRFELRPA